MKTKMTLSALMISLLLTGPALAAQGGDDSQHDKQLTSRSIQTSPQASQARQERWPAESNR